MATVNEEIKRIKDAKAAIKTSIENKGVVVPAEAHIEEYAAKIDAIQTGGGGGIDLTGTGWETEPTFPVDMARFSTLNEDIEYTRQMAAKWHPGSIYANGPYTANENIVYAPKVDTSNVIYMYYMFSTCSSLTSVPQFDTRNVTDMKQMFFNCSSLKEVPQFDTSNVTIMQDMFSYCSSLTTVPHFDTRNVTNMNSMFRDCTNLISVPQFDVSNVTDMSYCFRGCENLTNLGGFSGLKVSFGLYEGGTIKKLTKQSILNVIAGLATVTNNPLLKLGPTNLAKLTPEEIAVGTAKGWTIA